MYTQVTLFIREIMENTYISQVKDFLINNNMDRIEINGVWYVKEALVKDTFDIEHEVTFFEGCVFETDKHCFEASTLSKGEDLSIEVTYKKGERPNWTTDYWDNTEFFKGILKQNPDSLKSLRECIYDDTEIKYLTNFLQLLKDKGWIK
jgi:wyosine [tRNA(Phe)-imidazoG37] synthetase (radical SAM superfamily)